MEVNDGTVYSHLRNFGGPKVFGATTNVGSNNEKIFKKMMNNYAANTVFLPKRQPAEIGE